jgi:hypothetical protein
MSERASIGQAPPGWPIRHDRRSPRHARAADNSGYTCSRPWAAKFQRVFAQSVLSSQYRLVIDLGDLLRADPEARWASWQRARQAGVLSPNDVRRGEGWPASTHPTANSIEPPAAGGKTADDSGDEPPKPAPPPLDDGDKIARPYDRRSRHRAD